MTNVHIDSSEKRDGLPEYDEHYACPSCKTEAYLHSSYGLAGGGIGPYTYCSGCDTIVTKSCESDED